MFNNGLKQPGEEHYNSLVHPKSCEIVFKFLLTVEVLPFNPKVKHNLTKQRITISCEIKHIFIKSLI